jgi:hypothetical protein
MSVKVFPHMSQFLAEASDKTPEQLRAEALAARDEHEETIAEEKKQCEYGDGLRLRQRTLTEEGTRLTAERKAFEHSALNDIALNPAADLNALAEGVARLRNREKLKDSGLQFLVETLMEAQRLRVLECRVSIFKAGAKLSRLMLLTSLARTREALLPAVEEEDNLLISGGRSEALLEDYIRAVDLLDRARAELLAERARQEQIAQARTALGLITSTTLPDAWRG